MLRRRRLRPAHRHVQRSHPRRGQPPLRRQRSFDDQRDVHRRPLLGRACRCQVRVPHACRLRGVLGSRRAAHGSLQRRCPRGGGYLPAVLFRRCAVQRLWLRLSAVQHLWNCEDEGPDELPSAVVLRARHGPARGGRRDGQANGPGAEGHRVPEEGLCLRHAGDKCPIQGRQRGVFQLHDGLLPQHEHDDSVLLLATCDVQPLIMLPEEICGGGRHRGGR
mmetsp:Transcript_11844/g.42358  ORF Transcript_11844/g.42358 Transcript_11844/m.42358 type:complete len:220 (-) Transcript_11844:356-1015(-)